MKNIKNKNSGNKVSTGPWDENSSALHKAL